MAPPANPLWWHTGVIYQIYPRSWADANGDGIGDFDGITSRLDYLVDTLPVDALWLSPFFPSPMADFGYDVSDYCDIDPMFGDLASFDRFLQAAHERGLKVIIDYVINHTSDRHPWFVESRSSRDNPKRDWYVWRHGRDGDPPNNWRSLFGGEAWTLDPATGQHYLHSFLSSQPDLNWRNPAVEEAMFDVLRFWLDRGVDGFRIDVAARAMKDPALRDNPLALSPPREAYKLNPEYAAYDHLYDGAHPDVHALFRRLRRVVDGYESVSPRFTIGEIHEYDWRVWGSYFGWELDELHMPYNFVLLPVGMEAEGIRRAVEGMEAAMPSGAWPNWVVGNHDEPRITERYGPEAAKAAAVLLLTLRGTPTIYYGDELGMLQADIPPDRQQDPWGRQMPGFGRDGCRTPMQWDAGPSAGFSPEGAAAPWLPVPEHARVNVASELGDPDSYLSLYRRLLEVRRRERSLLLGDIDLVASRGGPLVYRRALEGAAPITVALNLSDRAAEAPVHGHILVGTHHDRWGAQAGGSLRLRPWEAVVVGPGS
jgi:glycosidase